MIYNYYTRDGTWFNLKHSAGTRLLYKTSIIEHNIILLLLLYSRIETII